MQALTKSKRAGMVRECNPMERSRFSSTSSGGMGPQCQVLDTNLIVRGSC
jgi:hypothetical protein